MSPPTLSFAERRRRSVLHQLSAKRAPPPPHAPPSLSPPSLILPKTPRTRKRPRPSGPSHPHDRARHRPQPRRAAITWDHLPPDVQTGILAHLSLPDVHNLRLAGAGAASRATHALLSAHVLRRVRALQPAFESWHRMRPSQRTTVRPTAFAARRSLRFVCGERDVFDAVTAELFDLRELEARPVTKGKGKYVRLFGEIDAGIPDEFCSARLRVVQPLREVDASKLACLTQLRRLSLRGHDLPALPEPFPRMPRLRVLDMSYNRRLVAFPERLAEQAPLLFALGFAFTRVAALPQPMFRLLEQNVARRLRPHTPPAPLEFDASPFTAAYLDSSLRPEHRFPMLRKLFSGLFAAAAVAAEAAVAAVAAEAAGNGGGNDNANDGL